METDRGKEALCIFARATYGLFPCHCEEGMMTVEASVIIPLLSFVILIVVFFSITMLDMAAAKSQSMIVADQAAASWEKGSNLSDGIYDRKSLISRDITYTITEATEYIRKQSETRFSEGMDDRFIYSKTGDKTINTGIDRITIGSSIGSIMPFKRMTELLGAGSIVADVSSTAAFSNWEELLRLTVCLKGDEKTE